LPTKIQDVEKLRLESLMLEEGNVAFGMSSINNVAESRNAYQSCTIDASYIPLRGILSSRDIMLEIKIHVSQQ